MNMMMMKKNNGAFQIPEEMVHLNSWISAMWKVWLNFLHSFTYLDELLHSLTITSLNIITMLIHFSHPASFSKLNYVSHSRLTFDQKSFQVESVKQYGLR